MLLPGHSPINNSILPLTFRATVHKFGKRVQISRRIHATSDKAAEEAMIRLYNQKDKLSENHSVDAPQTLGALHEEFNQNHLSTLRPSTQGFYANLWNTHLKQFEKAKLKSINPKMVYQMLAKCQSGDRTKKGVYGMLRTMFSKAVLRGYMSSNPCEKVEPPKYKAVEKQALDEIQLTTALEHLKDEPILFQCIFYLAVMCGMRRGEIMGLEWKDIDFKAHEINVRHAAARAKKIGTYHGDPKTKKSVRKLSLPDTLIPLLKSLRAEQSAQKLKLAERWNETPWVFKGWDGNPLNVELPSHWWMRYVLAHEELAGTTFHSLRHTTATLLIKNNVPISTVSGILGHSLISTTMNIYTHVIEDAKKDALSSLESIITGKKSTG